MPLMTLCRPVAPLACACTSTSRVAASSQPSSPACTTTTGSSLIPTLSPRPEPSQEHYGQNAYHNRQHGADVLLGMHRFLDALLPAEIAAEGAKAERVGAGVDVGLEHKRADAGAGAPPAECHPERRWPLTALQTFGGLLAAAVHDFNHPGTTNAHELKVASVLARTYGGVSILESHHVACAFAALLLPQVRLLLALIGSDWL